MTGVSALPALPVMIAMVFGERRWGHRRATGEHYRGSRRAGSFGRFYLRMCLLLAGIALVILGTH
jgi:hypothetical protein